MNIYNLLIYIIYIKYTHIYKYIINKYKIKYNEFRKNIKTWYF